MKAVYFLPILFVLSLLLCGVEQEIRVVETHVMQTDDPEFVLSFGDRDLPDEYLLANPLDIIVDDLDRVMLTDECMVKVFSTYGHPITTFGGRGQGPGEFSNAWFFDLSPTGYLSVFHVPDKTIANIFRPDLSFYKKIRYRIEKPFQNIFLIRGLKLSGMGINSVFYLNDFTKIYRFTGSKIAYEPEKREETLLIYETPDTTALLAVYSVTNRYYQNGRLKFFSGDLGGFHLGFLPDNQLVYIHTYHDKNITEEGAFYTLNFLSLDTFEKSTLTRSYNPIAFNLNEKEIIIQETKEIYRERKFYPPLRTLITDNETIFAVTYNMFEEGKIQVDVIDGKSKKFLHSILFPDSLVLSPISSHIKDGYVYRLKTNEEGFYVVEKYKIDPEVYGK